MVSGRLVMRVVSVRLALRAVSMGLALRAVSVRLGLRAVSRFLALLAAVLLVACDGLIDAPVDNEGADEVAAEESPALPSEVPAPTIPPPPPGIVLTPQGEASWRLMALADESAPQAPDFPPAPERVPSTGGPRLRAKAWYVVDEDTGEVLTAKKGDEARPIASITKLAAMMLYFDAPRPDDELIPITRAIKRHMQITRSKLRVGGRYRAGDLVYSALLASDNRAAAAVAFSTGLPNEAFAAAMTRRAHAMGLTSAYFGDPTGLHPENAASPRDAVRLLALALDHPQVGPILRTDEHNYMRQDRRVHIQARNSNLLAHYDHWDTAGGKTGYTVVAGSCLVQRATIDGRRLLIALLGARRPDDRYEEMVRLRYWVEGLED